MKRIDNNGHVSFDPEDELSMAEEEVKRILSVFNPAHPATLESIMDIARWYGASIDKAWYSEYVDRTVQDAQQISSTTLAAVLAGMRIEREKKDERA